MNKNDVFPSKYMSAGDLPDEGATLTIRSVDLERMQDGEQKPIVSFVEQKLPNGEKAKDMLLNVTKWNTIALLYGDESDSWAGKKIAIRPGEVKYQGKMVACIDVSSRKPGKQDRLAPGSPKALRKPRRPLLSAVRTSAGRRWR